MNKTRKNKYLRKNRRISKKNKNKNKKTRKVQSGGGPRPPPPPPRPIFLNTRVAKPPRAPPRPTFLNARVAKPARPPAPVEAPAASTQAPAAASTQAPAAASTQAAPPTAAEEATAATAAPAAPATKTEEGATAATAPATAPAPTAAAAAAKAEAMDAFYGQQYNRSIKKPTSYTPPTPPAAAAAAPDAQPPTEPLSDAAIAKMHQYAIEDSEGKQRSNDVVPTIIAKTKAYAIDEFTPGNIEKMNALAEAERLEKLNEINTLTNETLKRQIEYHTQKNQKILNRLNDPSINNDVKKIDLEKQMKNNNKEIGHLQAALGDNQMETIGAFDNNAMGMMNMMGMGQGMGVNPLSSVSRNNKGNSVTPGIPRGRPTVKPRGTLVDSSKKVGIFKRIRGSLTRKKLTPEQVEAAEAERLKAVEQAKADQRETLQKEKYSNLTRKKSFFGFGKTGKKPNMKSNIFKNPTRQPSATPKPPATARPPSKPLPPLPQEQAPLPPPPPSSPPPLPPPRQTTTPAAPATAGPPSLPPPRQPTKQPPEAAAPPGEAAPPSRQPPAAPAPVEAAAQEQKKLMFTIKPIKPIDLTAKPEQPVPTSVPMLSPPPKVTRTQNAGGKTRKNRQHQYMREIKDNRTHLFNKEMEILNSIRNFKNGHIDNDNTKKQFMKAVKRG